MSVELAELSAQLNRETVALQQEEIRRLESEIAALKRGEFICSRCGLRKNADGYDAQGHSDAYPSF